MKNEKLEKLRNSARSALVKSEMVSFRMPADRLALLYEIAEKNQTNVSLLLRDWANEKIDQDNSHRLEINAVGDNYEKQLLEMVNSLTATVQKLSDRLTLMEQRVVPKSSVPSTENHFAKKLSVSELKKKR